MSQIEEATMDSEFSLANEGHKKFYSIDHFLPNRKRDVKEDRKRQRNTLWTDAEINQLQEGLNTHGKDNDLLE